MNLEDNLKLVKKNIEAAKERAGRTNYVEIIAATKTRDLSIIEKCFNLSIKILKKNKSAALINGPISKSHFLKKKFPGITEYIAKKTSSDEPVMLIYNKKLSVSQITTN